MGGRTSQSAYDEAFGKLFEALDALEERLGRQRYLMGRCADTEADWRLYPNLIRFDPIYFVGYRCNLRRIVDYPNLSNYLRELYQTPGIADVSDIDGMKAGTFGKADRSDGTGSSTRTGKPADAAARPRQIFGRGGSTCRIALSGERYGSCRRIAPVL